MDFGAFLGAGVGLAPTPSSFLPHPKELFGSLEVHAFSYLISYLTTGGAFSARQQ